MGARSASALRQGLALRRSVYRYQGLSAARYSHQGRPHEHGALDRTARASPRSQARRVRRYDTGQIQAPAPHDQVHFQAGDARHSARCDHRPAEAWLRRSARALVSRPLIELRPGSFIVEAEPRARHFQSQPYREAFEHPRRRPPPRYGAVAADLLRALVPDFPRCFRRQAVIDEYSRTDSSNRLTFRLARLTRPEVTICIPSNTWPIFDCTSSSGSLRTCAKARRSLRSVLGRAGRRRSWASAVFASRRSTSRPATINPIRSGRSSNTTEFISRSRTTISISSSAPMYWSTFRTSVRSRPNCSAS